ncbi:hypothetical protein KAFR_0B06830 [Kazachstania africana CBS 2517]|uniref:Cystathionine gamma-synthase n=1 Tax=Kazachstania africana (strain ATCC 22294 / BCRC 22015 / CBS 2517 / CECT 1963 / NBRC 1671 / NRRL Y-8276) TaxID=1071382 RepID=H2ARI0_KAZAF|nr:hypothetical protein KAFR_0B06830 [Kazachstania africana CBS 2517]CCF56980.1 hypothetical protein KAFR_0B06830 [Kazachstania africana CBS 2517]
MARMFGKIDDPIPSKDDHPISVNLPTWDSAIEYAKNPSVFENGYPRMKLNKSVARLCDILNDKYAKDNELCLCFPSYNVAKRCREYIRHGSNDSNVKVRILQLATSKPLNEGERQFKMESKIAVVFMLKNYYDLAREYWELSGEIVSSRLAQYVQNELFMAEKNVTQQELIRNNSPSTIKLSMNERAKTLLKKRITINIANLNTENEDENYHFKDDEEDENGRSNSNRDEDNNSVNSIHLYDVNDDNTVVNSTDNDSDSDQVFDSMVPAEPIEMGSNIEFLENEENDSEFQNDIDGGSDEGNEETSVEVNCETDIFLFPTGMAALFTVHRLLLKYDSERIERSRSIMNNSISGESNILHKKTVVFGFSYPDTYKMLKTLNNVYCLPYVSEIDCMNKLKNILHSGEQILAVLIEAPSTPLLKMGNLLELKELSNLFGFIIIVDETVGGFFNVDALVHADVVCTSLTKIFSGDVGNVMAGAMALNSNSTIYNFAKDFLIDNNEFEDNLWCEDAIIMERNSRDFIAKMLKINYTTDYLLDKVLIPHIGEHNLFKKIYHPRLTSNETKQNYEKIKCKSDGGYGGVFSIDFNNLEQAKLFYNCLNVAKGPSLGTTMTLACPYTILYHYADIEKVSKYGLSESLIRVSVGLENRKQLCQLFQAAIDEAMKILK